MPAVTLYAALFACGFAVGLVVGVWLPSGMFSPVLTWYLVLSKARFFGRVSVRWWRK